MSKRETIIQALKTLGMKEVNSKSKKYRTFSSLNKGFYHVGTSGSVRYSTTNKITNSLSLSEAWKTRIIQHAERKRNDTENKVVDS